MSSPQSFDLAIIGSGPGGYVSAVRAAQLGMHVAIIEREELGGICLNWGCIPTKALLKSAELFQLMKRSGEFGITADAPKVDFPAVIQRSRQVANRLSKGVEFLMKKNKVTVIRGTGKFKDAHTLTIFNTDGGEVGELKSKHYLIATGARPRNLPNLELDGKKIISSRQAMTLPQQPKSMIIIGAGAIGVEFAYFYHAIGTEVTLVEMLPQILPLEDAETAEVVRKSFQKAGIKVFTGAKVEKVEKTDKGVKVQGNSDKGAQSWEAEICLVAVGVQGNSDGIGLESAGVEIEKSFIKTSGAYQTSAPHIFAIGDVIGAPMLAHAASHEGVTAIEKIAGMPAHRIDPRTVPSCTYCQPQVASIGWTEAKAREQGLKLRIGRFPFSASGKAAASGEREGFVKLIFEEKYGEFLGAHIVGSEATELLGELCLAQTHGSIPESIGSTIHAHPTLTEAVMQAALDALGRATEK